jgi:hypothetical protein
VAVDDFVLFIEAEGGIGEGDRAERPEDCSCRVVDEVFGCVDG